MTPYPLSWPDHIPRSRSFGKSQFRTPLPTAINNVNGSIRAFATDSGKRITDIVVSSNATLAVTRPADPGVAVWFTWDGLQVCIPVDRYDKVEDNPQAIHHILEARRVELRHGTIALVRASLMGFKALPPAGDKRPWREVLGYAPGYTPPLEAVRARYREQAKLRHPDAPGGSHAQMTELNAAVAEYEKEYP